MQKELLNKLAAKLTTRVKNKDEVIKSLQNAKILDKNNNFCTHYSNLKCLLSK